MQIFITPESFGNVAAEAMRYGFDVSAYLIRRALKQLPATSTATGATAPAPESAAERKSRLKEARREREAAELARYMQPRICPDNRLTATGPLPEPEGVLPVAEDAIFNL